jgi:23S rRNA maturation-related 3'-5' exoribonuclease YhaM
MDKCHKLILQYVTSLIHDSLSHSQSSPAEIQEEISHYLLDIENANLQRITRHLLKKYQERFYTNDV